ncbi:MAG: peptide MFS transporter [Porphyromonas sp.]|nr:peptide MFS transporter [Porphyromonas sp.]
MTQTKTRKHPKGLISAALANMGERFGFYIMMAILTLFISAKFGFSAKVTGYIYSAFYAATYLFAVLGGIIADKTKNYKGTIVTGILLMAIGYIMIGYPTPTPVHNMVLSLLLSCGGLFIIALGNGLFKGNLQAIVGQMYDDPRYSDNRDAGFQIFYMFINIGAVFAPFIAVGVRNWWLLHNGFDYNATLPELSHEFLEKGTSMLRIDELQTLANSVSGTVVTDLTAFVNEYLSVFSQGFHYAFMAAIVMMFVSLIIFIVNKSKFPDPGKTIQTAGGTEMTVEEVKMSAAEVKQRIYALFAVFGVVIFFWFSFHQNGYSLTYFARDYVNLDIIKLDLGFTTIQGAEIFQTLNPFFVVSLTPLVMWFFAWRKNKGKEISTPMKIAIGMGIAALAYVYLTVISLNLPSTAAIKTGTNFELLTPWVMVGLYFILTVAELFISPLGLSFVSKVAPPHLQGLMQGLWLAATAVGNSILFIGGILYESVPLHICWLVFVAAAGIAMVIMLSMVNWLTRITGEGKYAKVKEA